MKSKNLKEEIKIWCPPKLLDQPARSKRFGTFSRATAKYFKQSTHCNDPFEEDEGGGGWFDSCCTFFGSFEDK